MDTIFYKMTEENSYSLPATTTTTTTLSEEPWDGILEVLPFATETQEGTILAAGGSVPPPIEKNPIGDALCPLLLLAAFYFSFVYLKVMKKKKAKSAIRK